MCEATTLLMLCPHVAARSPVKLTEGSYLYRANCITSKSHFLIFGESTNHGALV